MTTRTCVGFGIACAGLLTAGLAWAIECDTGESAAADVDPGASVVLNPGGGIDDPVEEVLLRVLNESPDNVLSVEVCELAENTHPLAGGYITLNTTVITEAIYQDPEDPDDTFIKRVMIPFSASDVPPEVTWGPLQMELTYYDAAADAWLLAPLCNDGNSPGFAEKVGNSCSSFGPTPPDTFSDELGDYGLYWDEDAERGFVWANVNAGDDFAAGLPDCWADVNDDGTVDAQDLTQVLLNMGDECTTPPVGCLGDADRDGVVTKFDLAMVLGGWGDCPAPPADASIHHCAVAIDNTAGEAEWGPGTAGITHFTFELQSVVTPTGNGWTLSDARALLDDPALSFYQHPMESAGGAPPLFFFCAMNPALEFDSYWIDGTRDDPCAVTVSGGALASDPIVQTPSQLSAAWAVDSEVLFTEDLPYPIARYSIVVDDPCETCHVRLGIVPEGTGYPDPVLGTITGLSTHKHGLVDRITFAFDIVDVCGADVNDDETVDVNDLVEVIVDWTKTSVRADIDRSGQVSVDDLVAVIAGWGDCQPLPEACSFAPCE